LVGRPPLPHFALRAFAVAEPPLPPHEQGYRVASFYDWERFAHVNRFGRHPLLKHVSDCDRQLIFGRRILGSWYQERTPLGERHHVDRPFPVIGTSAVEPRANVHCVTSERMPVTLHPCRRSSAVPGAEELPGLHEQ